MKTALAAMGGAIIGGMIAVVFGASEAIREANDRAAANLELANQALATSERQAADLRKTRQEAT